MAMIPLEKWAANHKISHRTAQHWAKTEIIPARKVKREVFVKRPVSMYVIDSRTRLPTPGKAM